MIPTNFEGSNIRYEKPSSMTDEQCAPIDAFKGVDANGFPFILTAWMPSYEDIIAINEGRPVMLKITTDRMLPVCVYTYDENYQPN